MGLALLLRAPLVFPSARGRGEQLPLRLPEDQGSHGGVPHADDVLRRRDHLQEVPLLDPQVGRRRGCRQEALGLFFDTFISGLSAPSRYLWVIVCLYLSADVVLFFFFASLSYSLFLLFSPIAEQVRVVLPVRQDIQLRHV